MAAVSQLHTLATGARRPKELVGALLSFPAGNLNQGEVRKLQAGLDHAQMSPGTASSNSRRCFWWGQLLRSIRNCSGKFLVLSTEAKHTCTSTGFHSGHSLHRLGRLSVSIRHSFYITAYSVFQERWFRSSFIDFF